jgi:hypothetical protein
VSASGVVATIVIVVFVIPACWRFLSGVAFGLADAGQRREQQRFEREQAAALKMGKPARKP